MTEEKQEKQATKGVNDILNLMNRVNETFAYEIWIPSLKKEVMFRELNTAQQKRLIKSVIDSPIYNTEFIFAITQIIKENCIDDIDVNSLTNLDKLFICLKMRAVSIGDLFEFEFERAGKKHKRGISIVKIYNESKEKIDLNVLDPVVINDTTYGITLSLPTLQTEYQLEKEFRGKNENIEIDTTEKMRNTVGELYITELIKFIKQISIKTEEEQIDIDFNEQINFKNRIAIIERLPTKLIEKVISQIGIYKKEFEKVTLIKTTIEGENGEPQKIEEGLTIDGNFFISS